MMKHVWEIVVVVAAAVAIATNFVVMGTLSYVNRRIEDNAREIEMISIQCDMNTNYLNELNAVYGELQAEVHFGLSERYPDFKE